DGFWRMLGELSRQDGVTIFVSTHFMNEAELCDRISLMHAGRVLVSDTAEAIKRAKGAATLDDAFVAYLQEAIGDEPPPTRLADATETAARPGGWFSPARMLSYSRLESLQLMRDPIRLTLALIGSLILMFVIG